LASAALNVAAVATASLLTFFVMNPVLYSQPVHAGRDMITMRRSLAMQQATSDANGGSSTSIPTVRARVAATYEQLFWRPSDLGEATTYPELAPSGREYEQQYLVKFWNRVSVRVVLLLLSGLGFVVAMLRIIGDRFAVATRPLQVTVLWLLTEVTFVALFIPLDWQRYFLPLLPPVCIFAALGASWLFERTRFRRNEAH
jgi:hypothetical protein